MKFEFGNQNKKLEFGYYGAILKMRKSEIKNQELLNRLNDRRACLGGCHTFDKINGYITVNHDNNCWNAYITEYSL